MKIIGLTGGIGSGKSTAAKILAEFGAKVIDADKVAHEVFNPGTEGLQVVVETFGEGVLDSNGEIDRKKLGEIVFRDSSALATLNEIIHPRAYELTKSRLEEFRKQGVEVVILEVILLVEAGWDHLADEIWVTVSSEDTVVKRLQESRGLTKEEILTRIHAQTPNEEVFKSHVLLKRSNLISNLLSFLINKESYIVYNDSGISLYNFMGTGKTLYPLQKTRILLTPNDEVTYTDFNGVDRVAAATVTTRELPSFKAFDTLRIIPYVFLMLGLCGISYYLVTLLKAQKK